MSKVCVGTELGLCKMGGGRGMDKGAQRLLGLQGLLWQLLDNVHLSKSIQHATLPVSSEEDCTSASHVSVLAP